MDNTLNNGVSMLCSVRRYDAIMCVTEISDFHRFSLIYVDAIVILGEESGHVFGGGLAFQN